MKQEPVTFGNIPLRRSTRNKNKKASVDPLVKIECEEEEKTRLKRSLRQSVTRVNDCTDSIEKAQESENVNDKLFCNKCNFTYESMEIYARHQMQVHKDKISQTHCNFCNYTFATQSNFHKHLIETHNIEASYRPQRVRIRYPDKTPDIHDPNNFCSTCDFTFSIYACYRAHLIKIHGMKLPRRPPNVKDEIVSSIRI